MNSAALALALILGGTPPPRIEKLWVYLQTNLQVDRNADDAEALLRRAARAGYTGVLLADFKFNRLHDVPKNYFRNLARVRAAAAELRLELIPAVCPIGYSSGILLHDPDLAEGIPASVEFEDGRIVDDVTLKNGDFEDHDGDTMRGWAFQDKPGKVSFADGEAHSGKTSLKMAGIGAADPEHGHGRICQKVKVRKGHLYHVSAWVRTKDFESASETRITVLGGDRPLTHSNLGVKRTQDWTRHHAVFNSLDFEEAGVYFGVWGGKGGTIWWDDARVEPAGLVNLLRREGAPFLVDGKPGDLRDPRMGTVPWAGGYEIWHDPPVVTDKGRHSAAYYSPPIIHDDQVTVCPSEPRTHEIIRDQVSRVVKELSPPGLMLSHDEIRCLNQDKSCRDRGLDAGAVLADCVRKCAAICRAAAPKARLYIWSDMFDPHHNARKDYYLVRGDLAGSWEGLDREIVVVNWNHGKRDASLRFFAGRGHQQVIAGYYDGDAGGIREWLASAVKIEGVIGVMYTTWRQKYDDLEAFAKIVKEWRDRP